MYISPGGRQTEDQLERKAHRWDCDHLKLGQNRETGPTEAETWGRVEALKGRQVAGKRCTARLVGALTQWGKV